MPVWVNNTFAAICQQLPRLPGVKGSQEAARRGRGRLGEAWGSRKAALGR
ncbi:MAG: hypothetical protein QM438_09620 [Euryarchaeota archaeon]|nr:hypothetical protein [Euryarchaeota archaeon]